ncbi:hypothetical protein C8J56DRAFT_1167096 [Mycena floridula]|nr:hypothetical protein C8J56DRAFT_1167096 [Mycena floridula]
MPFTLFNKPSPHTLTFLLSLILTTNALSLFLDPTEPLRLAVGSYVNYTWETFDTDSGWSFFRVRLRLSTSTTHLGPTNFAHHGDEIRKANLSLAPPLDDGSYVLSAFLISSDPGGQPNGEVFLADSESFEIFHSETVAPSSTTTESPTSTSTSQLFTSIFQSPTFISTDSQSFTPISHPSSIRILEPSTSVLSTPNSSTLMFQIPTTVSTTTSSTQAKPSQTAIIAGSVCGGIIFLLVLLFLLIRWHRRRQNMLINRPRGPQRSSSDYTTGEFGILHVLTLLNNCSSAPLDELDINQWQTPSTASTFVSTTSSQSLLGNNPTQRQLHLKNELMERVSELERAMSQQAVTTAAENARLRAEVEWLRENQESDWARGLTDELPPSYPDIVSPSYLDIMQSNRTR